MKQYLAKLHPNGYYFNKSNPNSLVDTAFASEADVLLYGHTHIPCTDYRMAMEIMNPGSIGNVPDPTYGVLEINGYNVKTKIVHVVKA